MINHIKATLSNQCKRTGVPKEGGGQKLVLVTKTKNQMWTCFLYVSPNYLPFPTSLYSTRRPPLPNHFYGTPLVNDTQFYKSYYNYNLIL